LKHALTTKLLMTTFELHTAHWTNWRHRLSQRGGRR